MKAIVLHVTRYRLEAANDSIGGRALLSPG
jgi:hypothetical protein